MLFRNLPNCDLPQRHKRLRGVQSWYRCTACNLPNQRLLFTSMAASTQGMLECHLLCHISVCWIGKGDKVC